MTNITDLAREAGLTDSGVLRESYALGRFASLHRAAIIEELTGEMPEPVAWRCTNWSGSADDYIYRDADDCAVNAKGEKCGEPLFALDQLREYAAGQIAKAVAAERGIYNMQTYKQAIKQVRGLNEQIALLEGTLESRERNIEMLKANVKMLHDALQTCRVMGVDAQGNYTKEITPKIIRDALEATK